MAIALEIVSKLLRANITFRLKSSDFVYAISAYYSVEMRPNLLRQDFY